MQQKTWLLEAEVVLFKQTLYVSNIVCICSDE